jgi:phthiocerol/phenolphthiocerol synthesis type-I polyketide synthase E
MAGVEDRIAVIGLAGRFPGAPSPEALFDLLERGGEGITAFSEEELLDAGVPREQIADPHYVRARGAIDAIEYFDADFFGLAPGEARLLDPQHRLFLEHAWEALEDAGYPPPHGADRVGIFAAASRSTYLIHLLRRLGSAAMDPFALDGTLNDFLPARAAHELDLRGPAVLVQTACSSSLVAVHLACQSLLTGESSMALAGAASIAVPSRAGAIWHEGGITSPEGHCRPFDARANGTVGGDAVAVVVLKRLADAIADRDFIHAVILGSAVNNDGAARSGFTAPGALGQAAVIREALLVAGVAPSEIGYVEAHGSGTAIGDPIEIAALADAFGKGLSRASCPVGSIKSNIGHTDVVAGLAGLIKAAIGLRRRTLVPTAGFERSNPRIPFEETPFFVQARTEPWPSRGGPRRASVSSFGMGGTNAHAVLEEPPPRAPRGDRRPIELFVLSARSRPALETMTSDLGDHLRAHPDLDPEDVAFTLQAGRAAFDHRRAIVARSIEEAAELLAQRDPARVLGGRAGARSVAFLFPGLGDQQPGMVAGLYLHFPVFRAALDRAAAVLDPILGADTRALVARGSDRAGDHVEEASPLKRWLGRAPAVETGPLAETALAQPILLAVELALYALWTSIGVRPSALLGYSLGEYAAAAAAGVFSFEDALRIAAGRARLIASLPPGAMTAVPLPPEGAAIASKSGPRLSVVSGSMAAITDLEGRLGDRGIPCRRLDVRHSFHTEAMRPVAAALAALVAGVPRRAPSIPYLSNVTGTWITDAEATDPSYWAEQLCRPVELDRALSTLVADPDRVFVELGPGAALQGLALLAGHRAGGGPRIAVGSLPPSRGEDLRAWLESIGRLWIHGVTIDWSALHAGAAPGRIPLPKYPFERSRHWVDGPEQPIEQPPAPAPRLPEAHAAGARNARERALQQAWQAAFGIESIGIHDDFFDLGGHSLLAVQLLHRIRRTLGVDLSVRSLVDHPTIASLADHFSDLAEPRAEPLRDRLAIAGAGEERRSILEAHVVAELSRSFGRPAAEVRAAESLLSLGLEQAVADLVHAFKRDLGRPVYPHEILARPTVASLVDLAEEILAPTGKNPPAAFLLSSARSGSTLLRVMLAGHPDLFCPPELHLLMYGSLRERAAGLPSAHFGKGLQRALMELRGVGAAEADAEVASLLARDASIQDVYRLLQELSHPRLLVDKSPSYAERIETLERAPRLFASAPLVFLVRHPYAVIESYVRNRIDRVARDPERDPFAQAERHWVSHNRAIMAFLESGHAAHRVRFEDLVSEPEAAMRGVCAALGVSFRPEVLLPYDGRARMIDGAGDPNLHERDRIEPELGDAWRRIRLPRPLGPEARALAASLGYALPHEE